MSQLHKYFKSWKYITSRDIYKDMHSEKKVYCDNLLVPFEESKYIVFSSCLFLIPTVYAFVKEYYIIASSGTIVTIVSINYWRECKLSVHRDCDLVVSKMMCGVGCWLFLTNIQNNYDYLVFIILFVTANQLYNNALFKNIHWIKYHILFHCILSFSALLTLYKMSNI
jgi:hypothetical protein